MPARFGGLGSPQRPNTSAGDIRSAGGERTTEETPARPPDPSAEGFGPQAEASGVRAAGPSRRRRTMLMPQPDADAVQALRRWLLAFKGELGRLAVVLDELRDRVDGMGFDVEQVLDRLPDVGDQLPPFRPSPPRAARAEDSILRRQAVLDIELDRRPNGSADVSLDGHKPFHLPGKLAALLAIIAAPSMYPAADGLVGWRSYDDVAAVLTKRTGRVQTAATLIKHISKLKNVLRKAGENVHLVETDHQGRVRFRRRIAKAGAPEVPPVVDNKSV